MDMDRAAIGAALRRRRVERLGRTLRDVAPDVDLAHGSVGQIETGDLNCTIDTLLRVADVYGVEIVVQDPSEPRAAIVSRLARVLATAPDEDLDVFTSQVALWERRHGKP